LLVLYNTGINTGIDFLNTEIPVLPNVVGIGGPTLDADNNLLIQSVHYKRPTYHIFLL